MTDMFKGVTDQSLFFELVDSTTGLPKIGIVYTDVTGSYSRTRSARVAITMATLASASASHADGGFILEDDTNQPGVYRFDIPDAAFATGAFEVVITVKATGCRTVSRLISLVDVNNQVAYAPNVASGGVGGLLTAPTTANTGLSNVTQLGGVVQSLTDLKDFADDGYDPSTNKVQGVVLADAVTVVNGLAANVITATSIQNDAITATKIADGAIDSTTFAAGAITASAIATSAIDADAIATDAITEIQAGLATGTNVLTSTSTITALLPAALVGGRMDSYIGAIGSGVIDSTAMNVNGSEFTAIPWNSAWDTEVQSEVQDAIEVNHLDHLLAVDYDPASKPGTATALLNELIGSDAGVSQFTANALELAPTGGSAPTAAAIADAVWEELVADHSGVSGSTAEALAAILVDTAEIGAAGAGLTNINLPNQTMDIVGNITGNLSGSVGSIGTSGITTGSFAAGAIDAAAMNVTGSEFTAIPWNAAWDTEVQSEVQDAIEVNHLDHLLAVDYDPASKPGTATALLNEIIGSDAGVSQFTANALELAPTGGSAPTVGQIADAVWEELVADHSGVSGSTAEALAAAGGAGDPWITTLPGSYTGSQAGKILADVLVDTAEIGAAGAGLTALATQASVNTIDDFLDTEIAAIKAKTDNLPLDPADASDIASSFTTVNTKLDTIDDFLDLEIAAIKAKTDNLPSDPADASDIAASFAVVNTKLDTIDDFLDTEIAALTTAVADIPTNSELAIALGTADDAVLAAIAILQTSVDVVDDFVDTEVAAIKAKTDLITAFPTNFSALGINASGHVSRVTLVDTTTTNTDLVSAASIATAVLTTQLTESYAADGVAPTLSQATFLMQQAFTEFQINSTTITVKKLDGSTTAATFTMDHATQPTLRTRAT